MSTSQPNEQHLEEAHHLVNALLDDRISDGEARRLEALICEDVDICRLYLRCLHQECVIARYPMRLPILSLEETAGEEVAEKEPLSNTNAVIMPALHELEDASDELKSAPPLSPRAVAPVRRMPRPRLSWRRLSTMAVSAAAAAMLAVWSIWPKRPPRTNVAAPLPVFATIERAVNASWGDGTPAAAGYRLAKGQFTLGTGIVEVVLNGGPRAVVEAPAVFQINSDQQLTLASGRMVGHVKLPAIPFTVNTPSATIVDQGTEFGVSVDSAASTSVEVFEGKVRAATVAANTAGGEAKLLASGQAATVSAAAVQLNSAGASPQRFVRELATAVTALDVVDLVSGGDGATRRRGMSINPLSGNIGELTPMPTQPGDGKYHRVSAIPVIDGCFVPDGTKGPAKVDSVGHTFSFPATCNRSFNQIWTGGAIPVPPPYTAGTTIGGVDYSTPDHALIYLHSNKGLTIDLAAIRRLYPGGTIARFRCTFGFPSGKESLGAKADAFVLVDGDSRFERRAFTVKDSAINVDVPLTERERFLTLAVTDGGDGIGFDGVLCADPKLVMSAR